MYIFFRSHDQYKKSWSKQNQARQKAIQKKKNLFTTLDTRQSKTLAMQKLITWIIIMNKMNRHIEEINGNNIDILKKHEELWDKIWDLTRSITNNSDNYNEKYMKIKFN